MKDMESLFAKAIGEIERILNTKTVVGDPITVEGHTLIPIVSVGTVVAEGAELPAEVDVLGGLDCDLVQGFVFSPPVAADKAPLVAASIEREARRIGPKRNRL